jgi:predicted LPLAT superfamily acyltransferase
MAAPEATHWARMGEAGAMLGLRALLAAYRWLGRRFFRALLVPVMAYFYLRRGVARRASQEFLERLIGPAPFLARHGRSFRHFLGFGECALDKLLAWSGELSLDTVALYGSEPLLAQLAGGRGALLLLTHLGNPEVSRALGTRRAGLRMAVLIHTKHAGRFNRLLAALSPESQVDLIQVTEVTAATAIQLRERIDRGEAVAIAADRVPVSADPRVVPAPFLGAPALFPVGPFLLGSLLACPAYLLVCLRGADGYHLYVEPFFLPPELPRSRREALMADAAARFAARLEHYCRLAPFQWFNFYPFWAPRTPPIRESRAARPGTRAGAP